MMTVATSPPISNDTKASTLELGQAHELADRLRADLSEVVQQKSNNIAQMEEVLRTMRVASRLEGIYAERQSRLRVAYTFDAWVQIHSAANSAKRAARAEGKSHALCSKLLFRGREIAHFLANKNHLRVFKFRVFLAWRRQTVGKTRYIHTMTDVS
jgi:hypothetical protein